MSSTSSIGSRPIPCAFLGKTKATKLWKTETVDLKKSAGHKKVRGIFAFQKASETDIKTLKKERAVSISGFKLKIPQRLFRSNRYGNVHVRRKDGCVGWVEVNLQSLSNRYNIPLSDLQTAANHSPNRDITQCLRTSMKEQDFKNMSSEQEQELMQGGRKLPGETFYNRALKEGAWTPKGKAFLKKAVQKGYAPAMYELAMVYLNERGKDKEMMRLIKAAIKKGHVPSQTFGIELLLAQQPRIKLANEALKLGRANGNETAGFVIYAIKKLNNNAELNATSLPGVQHFIQNVILSENRKIARDLKQCLKRVDKRIKYLDHNRNIPGGRIERGFLNDLKSKFEQIEL